MSDKVRMPSTKEFLKHRPLTVAQKRMNRDLNLVQKLRKDPKKKEFSPTKELIRNMGRKRLAKKNIRIA